MAYPKRKSMADCSHLPYTPGDAKRILRTRKIDYVEIFPRPENETGFYLEDLIGNPILSWPPELPKYDPRGHPSSPNFESWKRAQASKIGIPGNNYNFKGSGLTPSHSGLEERCFYHFGMNPFVVEVRAQYPEWNRSVYRENKTNKIRMNKISIITIDFVLALKIPGRNGLHYHAVSVKPYAEIDKPSVKKRHKREVELLSEWGCTHEVMTEYTISVQEYINNRRLFEFMKMVDDISEHRNDSIRMAARLMNELDCRTLDKNITAVAKSFGWNRDLCYRLFAIANFFGYLRLDHDYDMLPDNPLYLKKY